MRRRLHGLSLIELLVASALGLLLLSFLARFGWHALQAQRRLAEELALQRQARNALERIARDVRRAGHFGCSTAAPEQWQPDVAHWPQPWRQLPGIALQNLTPAQASFWLTSHSAAAGSDILQLAYAQNPAPATLSQGWLRFFPLDDVAPHSGSRFLLLNDCHHLQFIDRHGLSGGGPLADGRVALPLPGSDDTQGEVLEPVSLAYFVETQGDRHWLYRSALSSRDGQAQQSIVADGVLRLHLSFGLLQCAAGGHATGIAWRPAPDAAIGPAALLRVTLDMESPKQPGLRRQQQATIHIAEAACPSSP